VRRAGDRVFVSIPPMHQGWATICSPQGSGRWLVRLEGGGTIVLPEKFLSGG
jgi:hypothetical protein